MTESTHPTDEYFDDEQSAVFCVLETLRTVICVIETLTSLWREVEASAEEAAIEAPRVVRPAAHQGAGYTRTLPQPRPPSTRAGCTCECLLVRD